MSLSGEKSFLAEETTGPQTGSGSTPGRPKNVETSTAVACSGANNKGKVLGDEVTEGTGNQILLSHAVWGKVHGVYRVRSKARKLQAEMTPSLSCFQRGIIHYHCGVTESYLKEAIT